MARELRVLYVTSEWPTDEHFWAAPFIVRQVGFLREAGVDVDVFPYRGHRDPLNYLRIYRRLHGQLRRERYDVVHAQFGHSGFLAILPKRAPLVVTFQGSELLGIYQGDGHYHFISRPLRLVMQFVAYRADEVILVADHMRRFLWRKDYHVIPGGLDLNLFKPIPQTVARRELELPEEERLVLFVGSPSDPVKRHRLAQAVVDTLGPDLNARLLVVTGVPPAKVPIYMNAADALLVTSNHEGSPNVVKEAMACNLPIVSVEVGDVRERLADVDGCAVVASDDPEVIARSLRRILRNNAPSNGREAAQRLSEEKMVQRQINVYRSAMQRNGR